MPEHGIPPSLDRLDYRRAMIASVVVVVLLLGAVGGLFVVLTSGEGVAPDLESAHYQQDTLSPFAEEMERSSAYAVLREHVDAQAWGPEVRQAYCRDSWHRIVGTYFEFHGRIELELEDGTFTPLDYAATLSGSSRQGWKIVSFGTEEVEGEVGLL